MIRFVRSASIAPGKLGDAIAFAKHVSDFVKRQYGVPLEVMLSVGGNPNRIAWRAEYESLAAMDAMQSKMLADREYLDLVAKGSGNFLAGTVNDVIWRTI
jgi:hypothetical protein